MMLGVLPLPGRPHRRCVVRLLALTARPRRALHGRPAPRGALHQTRGKIAEANDSTVAQGRVRSPTVATNVAVLAQRHDACPAVAASLLHLVLVALDALARLAVGVVVRGGLLQHVELLAGVIRGDLVPEASVGLVVPLGVHLVLPARALLIDLHVLRLSQAQLRLRLSPRLATSRGVGHTVRLVRHDIATPRIGVPMHLTRGILERLGIAFQLQAVGANGVPAIGRELDASPLLRDNLLLLTQVARRHTVLQD
eukprot:4474607-Pyramimonas_sp.AAC.2